MIKITLLLFLFSTLLLSDHKNKKKIFILHSYAQEYDWTKRQHQGFVQSIQNIMPYPVEFSTEYLDTKRLSLTPQYSQFFLEYLKNRYKGYMPDAIYVSDDNALEFMEQHTHELFPNSKIFFSGVNNIEKAMHLDTQTFAGVIETKDLEPNIELIRQLSPQTREIWFIGDDSPTYKVIEKEIQRYMSKFPNHTFHMLSSSNIDDIISQLPNDSRVFAILTTIGAFHNSSGEVLTIQESINTLKEKKKLMLFSMEDAYVSDGVIGGYVTSGEKQGDEAGKLLSRYLLNNSMEHISTLMKSPNLYMFDAEALNDARLVLSEYTARNAVMFGTKLSFFEKHKESIYDFLFLFTMAFSIIVIVILFLLLQQRRHLETLRKELESSLEKNSQLSHHLLLLQEGSKSGFWEYQSKTKAFNASEGLNALIRTDDIPLEYLDDLFSYIHSKDIDALESVIKALLEKSITHKQLTHLLIRGDGTTVSVTHSLKLLVHEDETSIIGIMHTHEPH